jgi:hypothetical protein
VSAYRPTSWPECLVVDSTEFRMGGVQGRSLHLLVAYGHERLGGPGRLWLVRPFPRKDAAAWYEFFAELEGTPAPIVSDLDSAIAQGIQGAFPRAGDPAPHHYLCELHIKKLIEAKLAALPRPHPVWDALRLALVGPGNWAAFEAAVWAAHNTGTPLATMTNWLTKNSGWVSQQVASRPAEGPYAVGALEATIKQLGTALLYRAHTLGNRRRTQLLLDLLACGLRKQTHELSWAAKVRRFLEANGGRPPAQRAHDDAHGAPSLYL